MVSAALWGSQHSQPPPASTDAAARVRAANDSSGSAGSGIHSCASRSWRAASRVSLTISVLAASPARGAAARAWLAGQPCPLAPAELAVLPVAPARPSSTVPTSSTARWCPAVAGRTCPNGHARSFRCWRSRALRPDLPALRRHPQSVVIMPCVAVASLRFRSMKIQLTMGPVVIGPSSAHRYPNRQIGAVPS